MGVLLWFCCIFSEYLFPRTPLEGYFCSSQCQGPWSPTVGSKSIFGLKKCNCGENNDKHSTKDYDSIIIIAQKLCFPIRISLVNMTKSAVSCGFGHIYWRNSQWKTSFFVLPIWNLSSLSCITYKMKHLLLLDIFKFSLFDSEV